MKNNYLKMQIRDKETKQPWIEVTLPSNCTGQELEVQVIVMLQSLYAFSDKAEHIKKDEWAFPETFIARLSLAYDWADGYKTHGKLLDLPYTFTKDSEMEAK